MTITTGVLLRVSGFRGVPPVQFLHKRLMADSRRSALGKQFQRVRHSHAQLFNQVAAGHTANKCTDAGLTDMPGRTQRTQALKLCKRCNRRSGKPEDGHKHRNRHSGTATALGNHTPAHEEASAIEACTRNQDMAADAEGELKTRWHAGQFGCPP